MLVGLRLPAREFRLGAAHLPAGTGFILDHLPEKGNGRHACGPATAILQAGLYILRVRGRQRLRRRHDRSRAGSSVLRALERTGYGGPLS